MVECLVGIVLEWVDLFIIFVLWNHSRHKFSCVLYTKAWSPLFIPHRVRFRTDTVLLLKIALWVYPRKKFSGMVGTLSKDKDLLLRQMFGLFSTTGTLF